MQKALIWYVDGCVSYLGTLQYNYEVAQQCQLRVVVSAPRDVTEG